MNSNSQIVLQTGGDFLSPAAALDQVIATYQIKKSFIETVLRDGVDFGAVPGTDKPTLKKPGAEKMATFFGLSAVFEDVKTIEDWTGQEYSGEPFFYYRQKCKLFRGERLVGSADGSCNSREKKYRYRWVGEADVPTGIDKGSIKVRDGKISEFAFAVEKSETSGKYGKPAEYWKRFKDAIEDGTAVATKRKTSTGKTMDAWEIGSMVYCIPNDDVAEQVNTILKMAQKRALVAAVLITTNASDYFTQDMEDFTSAEIVDAVAKPVAETPQETPIDKGIRMYKELAERATKVGIHAEDIPEGATITQVRSMYKELEGFVVDAENQSGSDDN